MNKKHIYILLLIFFFTFLIIGSITVINNMPNEKNERVYSLLKEYIPYKLEKRVGGFSILLKETGQKENPNSADVMKRLEELEKNWGKAHLRLQNNYLIILDDNKKEIKKIKLNSELEINWVKDFFNI